MPLMLVKAYSNRTARLKLTRFTRLKAETQTIGLTCFLELALWRTTDEAIESWLMRVSEVRRLALERAAKINNQDWQQRHGDLLARIKAIAEAKPIAVTMQTTLTEIVGEAESLLKQSRADRARAKLMQMSAQVRSLLRLIVRLPIQICTSKSWLNQALPLLRAAYRRPLPALPTSTLLHFLPALWRRSTAKSYGVQKLRMLEAATGRVPLFLHESATTPA